MGNGTVHQYYTLYWMGNGTVYQYVYSVYIIGWVMVWSISLYTLYWMGNGTVHQSVYSVLDG